MMKIRDDDNEDYDHDADDADDADDDDDDHQSGVASSKHARLSQSRSSRIWAFNQNRDE